MRPGYLIGSAFGGMLRALGLTVTSMATLSVGLWLMGLSVMALSAGRFAVQAWTTGGHVACGIAPEAAPSDWPRIVAEVSELAGVASVELITPEQALTELKASGAKGASLADGLEPSLLPASLRVAPRGSMLDEASLGALTASLARVVGIEDVEYGALPIGALRSILRSAALWATGLALALALALVFMVMSTIRLVLHSRRDEVQILQIIGATPGFVAAPFLLEGLIAGLAAGLFAGAATYGCELLLAEPLLALSETLHLPGQLGLFAWPLLLAEALGGAVLGVLGSYLAVHNFVRNEVTGDG